MTTGGRHPAPFWTLSSSEKEIRGLVLLDLESSIEGRTPTRKINELANCIDCGKKIGFTNRGDFGRCSSCTAKHWEQEKIPEQVRVDAKYAAEAARNVEIEAIMLTTETAPNLNIIKRIEIVTAECAFGMNVFKDLFIAISNVVGGRSETVQKAMRESRKAALYELKKEAYLVGANAVVGVDLDYVEMGSAGSSMVMLVASGTAVVIEEKQQ